MNRTLIAFLILTNRGGASADGGRGQERRLPRRESGDQAEGRTGGESQPERHLMVLWSVARFHQTCLMLLLLLLMLIVVYLHHRT